MEVDHTTALAMDAALRPGTRGAGPPHWEPTSKSRRVDEKYVRVKGRSFYLYRAIDSAGSTIDFFSVSATFRRCGQGVVWQSPGRCFSPSAVGNQHRQGQVLSARSFRILSMKGFCGRHRPVQYLNNILEQDYRAIEKDACQAAFSAVQLCAEDDSRLRGDAQDSEGTGAAGEKRVTSEHRTTSSIRYSASPLKLAAPMAVRVFVLS